MKQLFIYNWAVRDEWFESFGVLSSEELLKERIGGVGSINRTFIHIIDVEYSWFRALMSESDIEHTLDDYRDLSSIKVLSDQYREEIEQFLDRWNQHMELKDAKPAWTSTSYKQGEVLRHLIAHEIHHIGQLSVWAKELGVKQVNTNFIGRGIFKEL